MAEELALATVQETPDAALALVEAAGHRTQLHKRALRMLGSLQEDLGSLLDELSTTHPHLLASAAATTAQQVAVRQAPGALVVSKKTSLHNIQAIAQALGIPLPENKQAQELMVATQQRTDMVDEACLSIDDLCNNVEGFLADLLDAADKQTGQQPACASQQAGNGDVRNDTGTGTDVMKEAAATCAAAQRWQQRANDAQQAALTAQQQAWQKATEAATASAQATQAEHEAELLRVQGKLPEAMQAIRKASRLRLESETAMKESEALQTEHQARLSEVLEASHQALQVSQRAAQLEQLGLQIEAEQAEREAARYQNDYEHLLHEAQAARQQADSETANSQQLLLQVAEMQSAAIAAYAAGDVENGSRLNAEASQLQAAAQAAMQNASGAQQHADTLLAQAQQMSAQAGSASSQAQALQGSRLRLQSVAAQRDAARLQQQAAHALGASQQAQAEAEELQQLQEQYQRSSEQARARAKQLEKNGKSQEAAVEYAAAQAWSQLSSMVADKAEVARQEAAHKAGVGASLQRAADMAATGAADVSDTSEASARALESLLDPRQRQQSAHEAIKELLQAMHHKDGSQAAASQLARTGSSGGSSANDAEQLAADTEEAQQRAARLNKQLMLAAQHLARSGDLLGPEQSSSSGTARASHSGQQQSLRGVPESSDAALDGVAVSHMAQVVRLGRLGSMWKERAVQAQTCAAELQAEAENLEAEASSKEEAAAQLDTQRHWAEQSGDHSAAADLAARARSERSAAAQLRSRQESVREHANHSATEAQAAWEHAKTLARSIQALDDASQSFMTALHPAGSISLPLLPHGSNGSQQLSGLSSAILSRNTSAASRYGAASTTSTKDGTGQQPPTAAGNTQQAGAEFASGSGIMPASGNISEEGSMSGTALSRVSTLRGDASGEQDPMYLSFSQLPNMDQLRPPVLRLPDAISEEGHVPGDQQSLQTHGGSKTASQQRSSCNAYGKQSGEQQSTAGRTNSPFGHWQDVTNAEVDGVAGIGNVAGFPRSGPTRQHSLGAYKASPLGAIPSGLSRAASARAAPTMFVIDEGLPGGEVDSGTEAGSRAASHAAANSRINSFARGSDSNTSVGPSGARQDSASGEHLLPDDPHHTWSSFSRGAGGQALPASGQGSRMSLRASEVGDGAQTRHSDSGAVLSAAARALQSGDSHRYTAEGGSMHPAAEGLGGAAAAFQRLRSRRYSAAGGTSIAQDAHSVASNDGYDPAADEQTCIAAMGVDVRDPVAVAKARDYLLAGDFDMTAAEDQSLLAAMGVDVNSPAAVSKARTFLRTTSMAPSSVFGRSGSSRQFATVGGTSHAPGSVDFQHAASRRFGAVDDADEADSLEAMGVNLSNPAAVETAREYLRTGGFNNVAADEQRNFTAMGVDVSSHTAIAKARAFLRTASTASGRAALQHSVSRRYGPLGSSPPAVVTDNEQSTMECMGVDTNDAAAVAKAREYLHTSGFANTAADEQSHFDAMGVDVSSPVAVAKARAFLRTASTAPGRAALQHNLSQRYGPAGSTSLAHITASEQSTIASMGVDMNNPAAVTKAYQYLLTGGFENTTADEQSHFDAMGVDASSPAAVAKATAFLRTASTAPGQAALQHSFSRRYGPAGSSSLALGTDSEQSTISSMGVDTNDSTAVAKAREYLRTSGFANTAADDQSHFDAMGVDVSSPVAVAKARAFLRTASTAPDRAALQQCISRRYGVVGGTSLAPGERSTIESMGVDIDDPVAVAKAHEYLLTGSYENTAADEQSHLSAMGVDASSPAAVAKARAFLRTASTTPGRRSLQQNFSRRYGPVGSSSHALGTDNEQSTIESMGINTSNPSAVAKAREYLRTGGFENTAADEQSHFDAMGVDTSSPAAVAKARTFLRAMSMASGAPGLQHSVSGRYGLVGSTSGVLELPNASHTSSMLAGAFGSVAGTAGSEHYNPAEDEDTCIAAMGVSGSDPVAVAKAREFLRAMSTASRAPELQGLYDALTTAAADGAATDQLAEMGINIHDAVAVDKARAFLRTMSQVSHSAKLDLSGNGSGDAGHSTPETPVAAALQRLTSMRHTGMGGPALVQHAAVAAVLERLTSGRHGSMGNGSHSSEGIGPTRQLSRLLSRTQSRLGPSRLSTSTGLDAELGGMDLAAMQAADLRSAVSNLASMQQADAQFSLGSQHQAGTRLSSTRSTTSSGAHGQDAEGNPGGTQAAGSGHIQQPHSAAASLNGQDTSCNVASCASFGAWGATLPAGAPDNNQSSIPALLEITPGTEHGQQRTQQGSAGRRLPRSSTLAPAYLQRNQSARGLSSLADALDSLPGVAVPPGTAAGEQAAAAGQATTTVSAELGSMSGQHAAGGAGLHAGTLQEQGKSLPQAGSRICNAGRDGNQGLSLAERWLEASKLGSTTASSTAGSIVLNGEAVPVDTAMAGPLKEAIAAGLALPAELSAPGASTAVQVAAAAAVAADTAAMQVAQQAAQTVAGRLLRASNTMKHLEQQQAGHAQSVGKWEDQAAALSSEAEQLRAVLEKQQQHAQQQGQDPSVDDATAATARQLQAVELALQRATLLSDARAHQAQAASQQAESRARVYFACMAEQMEHVNGMQQHLQHAEDSCKQAQAATQAASHAAVAAHKAEAAVLEKQRRIQECSEQVADAQLQAATARQLANEALAAGNALQAAELQHKAETMATRAQQLLASLCTLKTEAAEAEALAGDVASQRDALRGRAEHLQAIAKLQQQMADAEQHCAHLTQQHADMLASAADLQAEATSLRVQQIEGLAASDRVSAASQGPLQQRAASLLGASTRLWDLVQEACECEVPALSQLCEQWSDLMAAEEALVMHQKLSKPSANGARDTAQSSGSTAASASRTAGLQAAATSPNAPAEVGGCGSATVDASRAITQHGVRVADHLAQLRAARQQLADRLVQHAGNFMVGTAGPMGNMNEHSKQAAQDVQQAGQQHKRLYTTLRTLLEAHDWLAGTQALAAHLDAATAELQQEEVKGTSHQSNAVVLKLPCEPLQARIMAAQTLSHSLQEQQQVSQARAASNAVGLLLSRAQQHSEGAAAQSAAASNSQARQELLQLLTASLQQLIERCIKVSRMLDHETNLQLEISLLKERQQVADNSADGSNDGQLESLQARLQALTLCRQHAEKSIRPAKVLCALHEQTVQLLDKHSAAMEAKDSGELQQPNQAEHLEKMLAATDAMLKHAKDWAEADQTLQFLDMADRYLELAESCNKQAASNEPATLQRAAAEAQIAVLVQQEHLQGLEQAARQATGCFAPCSASSKLNVRDRPKWSEAVSSPRKATTRDEHVVVAQAKLVQLKEEAAYCSWHADAAHMQQAICGQAAPAFRQLAVLAKQAARKQLQAAEVHAEQVCTLQHDSVAGSGTVAMLQPSDEAYGNAVLAADAAAQQLSQYEQGCCSMLHLHQQALKLEQACSVHTAAARAWHAQQHTRQTPQPCVAPPTRMRSASSLQHSASLPSCSATGHERSEDINQQLQHAHQDAGHQLHILVDHTRAMLNLHDAQEKVCHIMLQMQFSGTLPAEEELDAAGQLRLMALSSMQTSPTGTSGKCATDAQHCLLPHAKAMVDVQQAHVLLALSHVFEFAIAKANLAKEQAAQRSAKLATEAEAARQQSFQHSLQAKDTIPIWQQQDMVALDSTATRAHNRQRLSASEAGAQQAAAELASRYAASMHQAQATTADLQVLVSGINSILLSPVAQQLLNTPSLQTAHSSDDSAVAGLNNDASLMVAGAVDFAVLVQRACSHAAAAMQQQLSAAMHILSCLKCTAGIELVVAAINDLCLRTHIAGVLQTDWTTKGQADGKGKEVDVLISHALLAAASHHDMAQLHVEAIKLLQEQALLHSQALEPAQQQVDSSKAAVAAAITVQASAQAVMSDINQALDTCQRNLQAAALERVPVYRARHAVLQVQLEAAANALLAKEQQHASAKQQLDAAQLQLDLVQAAMRINTAAINQVWTALKWATHSRDKEQTFTKGTTQHGAVARRASAQLHGICEAVNSLQLSSAHLAARSRTTCVDVGAPEHNSQALQRLSLQAAATVALAAHHGAMLLESEGQLASSQQEHFSAQEGVDAQPGNLHDHSLQLGQAMRQQVQLRTVKIHHLTHLLMQMHEQVGWVVSCLAHHASQQGQQKIEQQTVADKGMDDLSSRFSACQDLIVQLSPSWLETCLAADSAAADCVNSWLLVNNTPNNAAVDGVGRGGRHSEGQAGVAATQKHVDAAQASAAQATALGQQADSIWEELQVQLEMILLQHAAPEALCELNTSSLQHHARALLQDVPDGLQHSLTHAEDGNDEGPGTQAHAMPTNTGVLELTYVQLEQQPADQSGAGEVDTATEACGDVVAAAVETSGQDKTRDQLGQAGTPCRPTEAAVEPTSCVSGSMLSPVEKDPAPLLAATPGTADEKAGATAGTHLTDGCMDGSPPAYPSDLHQNSTGSGMHSFTTELGNASAEAAQALPHSATMQPTVTKRTPLPPNMTPQQASFLLQVWRWRHHLASQTSHITSQLREVASQQVKDSEAAAANAHSSLQACITRGDPVGVAAATSTLNAARRQLHAAQQRSRKLNQQLGSAQQEAQDAGGMVERLWLHCGTQQTSANVVAHALQGSITNAVQHPDYKIGTLSPGARSSLQQAAIAVNLDAGSKWDAATWRSQPEQPWYISAAMHTGNHDGVPCLTSNLMQQDPIMQRMQQLVRASGICVAVDGNTAISKTGTSQMDQKKDASSIAHRECLLGTKQISQWASSQSTVQATLQQIEDLVQQLRHEEDRMLALTRQQMQKAEQAWAKRNSVSALDLSTVDISDKHTVLSAQADRYQQASQAAASWAAQLATTREHLALLQAELLSSVQALQHAQRDIIEAATVQLNGLQAHLECHDMVCQALLLIISKGHDHHGTWHLSSPHLKGTLRQDLQDVDQAVQLLEHTARQRCEVGVRFAQSFIERGQLALDTYIQASVQVSTQLSKASAALEQYAAQQAAQHNTKAQLEVQCSEKAGRSSRAALQATAGGHAELGQKLGAAADGWRASASSARQEATAAKQQAEQLHHDAIHMQAASEKLQVQASQWKDHINHVLDAEMRHMLATSRALALSTSTDRPALDSSNAAASQQLPHASTRLPCTGLGNAPAGTLHSSIRWAAEPLGTGTTCKRAFEGYPSMAHATSAAWAPQRVASKLGEDAAYEPEEQDAASARLLALHDKLQRLEEQVHMNKRVAVANARISTCMSDPSIMAAGGTGMMASAASPAGRYSVATTCSPNYGDAELYARKAAALAASHVSACTRDRYAPAAHDSPTQVKMCSPHKADTQSLCHGASTWGAAPSHGVMSTGRAGQVRSTASDLFGGVAAKESSNKRMCVGSTLPSSMPSAHAAQHVDVNRENLRHLMGL